MMTRWLPTWTLVPGRNVPGGALETAGGARWAAPRCGRAEGGYAMAEVKWGRGAAGWIVASRHRVAEVLAKKNKLVVGMGIATTYLY